MWLLDLLACHEHAPLETSTPVETSPTTDTAPSTAVLTAPVPAPEDRMREYSWNQFTGTALGRLGDDFVLTAPSQGWPFGDNISYCWVLVVQSWQMNQLEAAAGLGCVITDPVTNGTINSQIGTQLVTPGDVTGDSQEDLILFDVGPYYWFGAPAFLFAGPITENMIAGTDTVDLTRLGLPRRGAPCGDLSADGQADLCLDTGVAFGPITADSGLDVTWPAAGPSEHVRLLGWRDGLALWDDAAQALRWFAAISQGELDLGTGVSWTSAEAGHADDLATGDLDGDGADDLVVVRSNGLGATVHVLTDTAGGALAEVHATLTLPAPTPRTDWCNRPDEMCDPAALAVGDLDGDGQADLVVGWDNEVRVFLGPIPAGELSTDRAVRWWTSPVRSDTFGHALLIHDADLDGSPELIVGDPDSYSDWDGQFMYGRVYLLEL